MMIKEQEAGLPTEGLPAARADYRNLLQAEGQIWWFELSNARRLCQALSQPMPRQGNNPCARLRPIGSDAFDAEPLIGKANRNGFLYKSS
ncbi:hypothetical protein [Novosphingobium sp. SG707]|uniref:hypothetical protein n=1 Tax=Novosphingobium sp. SG707 TaxID=2586996 RepID=UPI00144807E4|nr:hypothetical protein [Novosphingobium sp. SG707]NKJ02365.1 hypothetical protein [Novosphingobium sp. SG707]